MVAETSGSNVSFVNLSSKLQKIVENLQIFKTVVSPNTSRVHVSYLDFPVPLSPIIRSFRFTVSMSLIVVGSMIFVSPDVATIKKCTYQQV